MGAAVDRLLFGALALVSRAFLLQGLAVGIAGAGTLAVAASGAEAWLGLAFAWTAALSATFVAAGLLMPAVRRGYSGVDDGPVDHAWLWPAVLGVSLIGVAGLAAMAGAGVPDLWAAISQRLAAAGVRDAFARGADEFAGILLLPIMLALMVPALVTLACAFSVAWPVTLLLLLPAGRRSFPALFATGAVCQAALVIAGWLAADAARRLVVQLLPTVTASGDTETVQVASELQGAVQATAAVASGLVLPLFGMLVWLVLLRPSGPAAASFASSGAEGRG